MSTTVSSQQSIQPLQQSTSSNNIVVNSTSNSNISKLNSQQQQQQQPLQQQQPPQQQNVLSSSPPNGVTKPTIVGATGVQSPTLISPPSTTPLPTSMSSEFNVVQSTSSTPGILPKSDIRKSNEEKGRNRSQSEDKQSTDNVLKESGDKMKKKPFLSPKLLIPSKKNSIGSEEPPISKTLDSRMKSNPYIKKFKLPSTETLINDYSAALFRQILLHGRLYLFTNYICFESKIFGIKTTEIILYKDVTSIKKKSKKFQFPVGIEIIANTQKFSFASFVSRDRTFNDLMTQWKEVTGESHDEISSHSIDDDEDESSSNVFENDSEQSSHSSSSNNPHASGDMILPTNSNGNGQTVSTTNTQDIQNNVNNSNINGNGVAINGNGNGDGSTTITTTTTTTTVIEQPKECNNNNINGNNNTTEPVNQPQQQPIQQLPQPQKVEDKSPFDELYGGIDQYISLNEQSSILESQSSEFQELLSDNFNVSVVNFFRALCCDKCNFAHTYHTKRGDKNITVKNWTSRERFGTVRELEYVAPVNSPIGPDKTRIQETQRYHLVHKKLMIETDTIMLDIPYGDHFRIEAKWEVVETSAETCRLTIQMCVRFIKKTWFKSKIETTTLKESKGSFQTWVSLAKQEVQKALQFKRPISSGSSLPSINITALNRSIDKIKVDEGVGGAVGPGGVERTNDSPKPHHTRSRSRQHLVSSSTQVNNESLSPFALHTQPTSLSPHDKHQPNHHHQQQQHHTPTNTSSSSIISPVGLGLPQQSSSSFVSPTSVSSLASGNQHSNGKSEKSNNSFKLKITSKYGGMRISGYPMLSIIILLVSLYFYMYLRLISLSSQVSTMETMFSNYLSTLSNNNKLN